MTKRQRPRSRARIIKLPAGWRPARKTGNFLNDALLPAFLVLLALFTVGLIVFAAGVLLGIIPYE